MKALSKQTDLNNQFTFDTFVVGPSNNVAFNAAKTVAHAPGSLYNPLFIHGAQGLGCTHLLRAIGSHVQSTSRAAVLFVSAEAFLNEYITALQTRTPVQFRRKYRNVDLLLIDDVHFLGGMEGAQEEFFHTFNTLFDTHKQIVMTSDKPANEIVGLQQKLVSRFERGLVTEVEPPDLETRIAILRQKLKSWRSKLPDEYLFYIARHVRSNVCRMEGALFRATSYASLSGKELSPAVLKHLLRNTVKAE